LTKEIVTDAQARKTALIVAGVLLLLGAWNFYRGRMTTVIVLASIGGALLFVGLLLPAVARRFHILWMQLAAILGYINSRILITVMFYGLITPFGAVQRLFGRDVLNRRARGRESYWIPREQTRQAREGFERQF
jgi:Saxitoxin biosynthesis operon protein SxtJ